MPEQGTTGKRKPSRPRVTGAGFAATVAKGDRRTSLEALRDELAKALERAEPSVAAQLAGQLRAVLKDLAELPGAAKKTKADELAARRQARSATA